MQEDPNFEAASVFRHPILYWLIGIAVIGFILRSYPFIAAGNAWRVPVDYDNGVYFSAAALLWKNIWPYRDYVFVHPPGILLFYSPIAAFAEKIDPAAAFVFSRWMAAGVGAINVFLTGRAAFGLAGSWAAVFAAGAYATHAEAIGVERGPFLEPALNLACLLLANVLIRRAGKEPQSRAVAKGFLAGLALLIKIWGGIWFLAGLAELVQRKSWRVRLVFLGSGLLTAILFAMPFVIRSPHDAIQQLLFFHLWRPPDGPTAVAARVLWLIKWHPLTSIFGLFGAVLCLARPWAGEGRGAGSRPTARYWATGYFLLIAAFLLSRTYWNQYNAHLAPAESVMAGFAFTKMSTHLRRFKRGAFISIAAALGAFVTSSRQPLLSLKDRDDSLLALGNVIRTEIPRSACLVPFEQVWGLVGGRLPQRLPNGAIWVDPYAAMLLDASRTGKAFTSATEAFQSASSQQRIRASLETCRFASLGSRGDWQLSGETKSWLREHFRLRYESHAGSSVDLWERNQ